MEGMHFPCRIEKILIYAVAMRDEGKEQGIVKVIFPERDRVAGYLLTGRILDAVVERLNDRAKSNMVLLAQLECAVSNKSFAHGASQAQQKMKMISG